MKVRPGSWILVTLLLADAVTLSYLVAQGTAFNLAHRLSAPATALLDVVALATLAHVILLRYQSREGADQARNSFEFRRRGLKVAVIGKDGRASTSKTMVVLWAGAVIWALIDLALLARVYPGGNLFSPAGTSNFRLEYLILFGLPVAAAVTAKAVVSQSNQGSGPAGGAAIAALGAQAARVYVRDPVPAGVWGFTAGVAELVTYDDGTVSWVELQYVVFTLITIVYFVVQVLAEPHHGMPAVPSALLILTGLSACGYMAAKIAETRGEVPGGPAVSGWSIPPAARERQPSLRPAEAQATPQVEDDASSDRANTLITLWLGAVSCFGLIVGSAALPHGSTRIGGLLFGVVATLVTLGLLIFKAIH